MKLRFKTYNHENVKPDQEKTMFFDESVAIARYDVQKYPFFEKMTDRHLGFFWRPDEIDVTRDAKDFKELTPHEQHIFTSNLKRQIVLDSVQGRSPVTAFLPIVSLPEVETWIQTWAFFETIHSRSYTHIIRNVYANPSEVFDGINSIAEIVDCAKDISRYYDELVLWNNHGEYGSYKHKKALWLALNAVNVLEGIRFYVSFACSWAFAEQKKSMEGNAKIIKLIARDENLHLASTQHMLKTLPKDDPDFAKIAIETEQDCIAIFDSAVEQEKSWAKYLFKDGSMVGLNEQMLCEYVEWLAAKRMRSIGLPTKYKSGTNPLPWTQRWIAGSEVQVAPQETEISSYIVGGVKKDATAETFQGFSL
jgi:ribonucleoside-diphosphate reductase beta chain